MNAVTKRTDGSTRNELTARVYPDTTGSLFSLVEDDRASTGCQTGAKPTTLLSESRVVLPEPAGPRRRIDVALHAVVMKAYVHGVSTRKVDDLVAALGVDSEISKS